MCTRYISPEDADIERAWHIGQRTPWRGREVFPRLPGAFVRDAPTQTRELVVGQWWLIADDSKLRSPAASTCNARFEDLLKRWSFRGPWLRGQRCIIPAESFFEPNWESAQQVPWRFRRADGGLWGLAGLWNAWADPETGELVESYTMLTLNADKHPLMNRMHTPDLKLPPDRQDKRSVVPIAFGDVVQWLNGTLAEAEQLVKLTPAEAFDAQPEYTTTLPLF
jgi:putative SOS response-associated peptidase YedK